MMPQYLIQYWEGGKMYHKVIGASCLANLKASLKLQHDRFIIIQRNDM